MFHRTVIHVCRALELSLDGLVFVVAGVCGPVLKTRRSFLLCRILLLYGAIIIGGVLFTSDFWFFCAITTVFSKFTRASIILTRLGLPSGLKDLYLPQSHRLNVPS